MQRKFHLFLICLGIGLFANTALMAREAENKDVFSSDSLLHCEIFLELDNILADRDDDPDYHPGRLAYKTADGNVVELEVEIRARGNFRMRPENCSFPPLKIKFPKKERKGTLFENVKDTKLVSHCQDDLETFEQYVLQEYLCYKAYTILTPVAFRVRLLRVVYRDLNTGDPITETYAFIRESEEDMAERNGAEYLELDSAPTDALNQEHLLMLSLFNYMILNTDFSIPILHNIELISRGYFKPPIPVPFDFDWSGIINIPYDSPFASSKSKYPERSYKGPCVKMKELKPILAHFRDKREQLYQLYVHFPYLDHELKSRNIQELELFYIILNHPSTIRDEFIRSCSD